MRRLAILATALTFTSVLALFDVGLSPGVFVYELSYHSDKDAWGH